MYEVLNFGGGLNWTNPIVILGCFALGLGVLAFIIWLIDVEIRLKRLEKQEVESG